ncbi:MAG: type II toxin-antitoxin system RelE/ParE family toxin [Desulfobacterales bacterium]|nr:type II toxin-antitoxin system RelE/ParE family toxin [Desulfobacterales bacterium]
MREVVVTLRALRQVERAAAWWHENRPAAPDAVADDFEAAKNLLARQPGIGARSRSARYPELRRMTLDRIRYQLYWDVRGTKVVILAFWHSSRGGDAAALTALAVVFPAVAGSPCAP